MAFLMGIAGSLQAHDPQFTTASFLISRDRVEVEWSTTVKSLVELTGRPAEDWQDEACRVAFVPELLKHLILSNGGVRLTAKVVKVETLPRWGGLKYALSFTSGKPLGRLWILYDIFLDLPDLCEPQDFANFRLGAMHGRHVFTAGARTLELEVGKMFQDDGGKVDRQAPGR